MDMGTYVALASVLSLPFAMLTILLNQAWKSEEEMKARFDFLWEAFSELQRERENTTAFKKVNP